MRRRGRWRERAHWLFLWMGGVALLSLRAHAEPMKTQPKPVRETLALAEPPAATVPDPNELKAASSRMRPFLERYATDRGLLNRKYPLEMSATQETRRRQFLTEWRSTLEKLDFDKLNQEDRIDYLLFRNLINHDLHQRDVRAKQRAEVAPLLPFAPALLALEEARERMEPIDAERTAALLNTLKTQIEETQKTVEAGLNKDAKNTKGSWKRTVANRAVRTLQNLQEMAQHWYGYYHGYDPLFTWWAEEPYKAFDQSLKKYTDFLREKLVGLAPDDTTTIIGDPIGREALLLELQSEMIPYTPEELLAIARKEMAWCDAEIRRASRALGYGDDWHKALEHVKTLHVAPGKQPEIIRDLALEAIDFLDKRDLVTIPPLARESWRMEMMAPDRQRVSPFFLGGEEILVSFPTNTMSQEEKQMSMRGNNIHFARATVQHELIPGHHLQGFMAERYRTYRGPFSTPFYIEGWALYWEMLLWDLDFAKSPENRIGMLFWRMHRCARILFSLGFHLEQMTPQECIEMLVERVGHERANATAEVRRSFAGDYPPLYQAAYLLGGLQIRALRHELVDSGKLTNRAFHDAILKENSIPIEMLRASLTGQKLTKDFVTNWKFYGEMEEGKQ